MGCGCELAIEAEESGDREAAAILAADAALIQARWRCPGGGHALPETRDHLDAECVETLEAVGRVTGFRDACTCPLAYVRPDVNPWLETAAAAWADREKGQLQTRFPDPDAVLIDACDVIRGAVSRRQAREQKARDAEMKKTTAPGPHR